MILIIDNYDSFTYNLVQLVGQIIADRNHNVMNFSIKNTGTFDSSKVDNYCMNDHRNEYREEYNEEHKEEIRVIRNDELSVDDIRALQPTHIILSPGPGYPKDAGVCEKVIAGLKGEIPILGVCLGHQAICETFGATISHAKHLMHGKQSDIHIANGAIIFHGLAPLIRAARYHSLVAKRDTLPDELLVIAEDNEGEVMAVQHRYYDIYGLQFHPESIMTPQGERIMRNFLNVSCCGIR